jgi:hypothetical protein
MTPEQLADEFERRWAVRRADYYLSLPRDCLVETFRKIGVLDLREFSRALATLLPLPDEWAVSDDLDSPESEQLRSFGLSELDWLFNTMIEVWRNPQIVDAPLALAAAARNRDTARQNAKDRHASERDVKQRRDRELVALMADLIAKHNPDETIITRAECKIYEWEADKDFNPKPITLRLKPSTLTVRLRPVRRAMLEGPSRKRRTQK